MTQNGSKNTMNTRVNKNVAILGANSHIAKGLMFNFFQTGGFNLHLYIRPPSKVSNFLDILNKQPIRNFVIHEGYEDFLKFGLTKGNAKKRAKEATQGIIEAIQWLDGLDAVIVVLDSTQNPYSQVNITIIGNLVARKIPVLIVANKIDLKKAEIKKIESAFPDYEVIGVSAKERLNMDEFYECLFKLSKKI